MNESLALAALRSRIEPRAAKFLLAVLCDCADEVGLVRVSLRALAGSAGVSEGAAARMLARLMACGVVSIDAPARAGEPRVLRIATDAMGTAT